MKHSISRISQKGFTIVELLIVIVVIGILASLVINSFTGVQQRARDVERKTDVAAIAKKLEVYYVLNGEYPTFTNLTTTSWINTNLSGIDMAAFKAPQSTVENSLVNSATPTISQYGYTVGAGNATFILYWREEVGGAVLSKASLNQ